MWREHLRIATRALISHRFRSSLTVFSIFIGAFSIVLMSSLANSGLASLVRDIERLGGARIILIMPQKPERAPGADDLPPGRFTREDIDHLFDAVPHTEAATVYAALDAADARKQAQKTFRTDFVAADDAFFDALKLTLGAGRLFTADENRRQAQVCVIADEPAQKLFAGRAVGKWLTIDGFRCRIIGQLAKVEHFDINFGFEWTNFVAMPINTVGAVRPEIRDQTLIHMTSTDVTHNSIVKRVANAVLAHRHRGVDDYQIWDFNRFMAQFKVIFSVLEAIVGLIAGIALLVGGIGVMNMMLVSVTERTKEIGIRKTLGASPNAIAQQFLIEASLLSGFGGLSGTVLGIVAAVGANALIASFQPIWVPQISIGAVIIAIGVSLSVGLAFGFLPAQRAARLDPVEAVRR
ncbi:MAG: ABC transporter permease [Myxococcota bacterium]